METDCSENAITRNSTDNRLSTVVEKDDHITKIDLFKLPDSVEMLDVLLQQSHIDINIKDNDGKTLLLKSINQYRSDSFIMRLLEANSDPNFSDKYQETPLYSSVTRPTITIAHELIKSGADVNRTTKHNRSPLHQAVDYNNLEAVCLLLYYGIDVNVLSKINRTPFMNALLYDDINASEILINYYDKDECLNNVPQCCTALYFAIQRRNPLAVQLVEMGADVNYVSLLGENLLVFSLFYRSDTLFKLMWKKFDYDIILNSNSPFLLSYIENCRFVMCDWVDSLHLILNSCVAFELVQKYNYYFIKSEEGSQTGFFQILLERFYKKKVKLSDRLNIIYAALKLGAKVNINDITVAYNYYGFQDELEILIYFIDYDSIANKYNYFTYLLVPFILAIEDDFDLKTGQTVSRLYNCAITCESPACPEHNWLWFFSRPCYVNLFKPYPVWWDVQRSEIIEKLLPEFPSLLELSRNQARKFIRCAYKINKPYQFHDVVKSMNLPQYIKDIVRFKAPVYK